MSATELDYHKLEVLGAALRDARMECSPRLTLTQLGSDSDAPRHWSHSHLSKIERGLEAPKEDLVRWYEVRTGKPASYLINMFYEATGGANSPAFLESQRHGRKWAIDRLELHADLSDKRSLIFETRDLVANKDGVDSHSVVIDTRDFDNPRQDYGVEVIEGGTITDPPEWLSDTLVKVEITLDRSFARGEWHRIRLCHQSPPPEGIPRWMTVSSRYGETREAVVDVAFNERDVRPAWRIHENLAAEVFAAFTAESSVAVEDVIGEGTRLVTDATGLVSARFSSLRTGLHYGIGWR